MRRRRLGWTSSRSMWARRTSSRKPSSRRAPGAPMAKHRIPAVCDVQKWAEEGGGLTTYGPDFPGLYKRAAELMDKILSATKPADIPVEQPTKFLLTVN